MSHGEDVNLDQGVRSIPDEGERLIDFGAFFASALSVMNAR